MLILRLQLMRCGLSIETFGTWLNTSLYEIPTLAIVNEVYFRMAYNYDELLKSFKERLSAKVAALEADEADEAQGKNGTQAWKL